VLPPCLHCGEVTFKKFFPSFPFPRNTSLFLLFPVGEWTLFLNQNTPLKRRPPCSPPFFAEFDAKPEASPSLLQILPCLKKLSSSSPFSLLSPSFFFRYGVAHFLFLFPYHRLSKLKLNSPFLSPPFSPLISTPLELFILSLSVITSPPTGVKEFSFPPSSPSVRFQTFLKGLLPLFTRGDLLQANRFTPCFPSASKVFT